MKPLLIIATGEAPSKIRARLHDFPQHFRLGAGVPVNRVRTVRVFAGETLPAPREVAGAFITGSAAMLTEHARWSENTAAWIRTAMDAQLPLFGVCYGHQLMAYALGGRVDALPGGREIGTHNIIRQAGASLPVLDGFPGSFRAHLTHQQSVLEVPSTAVVYAHSERDPHQLLVYADQALSTQFHPEFSVALMKAYIQLKHAAMVAEDQDPQAALARTHPAPWARRLLRRFARHCLA